MLNYYKKLTSKCEKLFNKLLDYRLKQGKEDSARINERRGQASIPRPTGSLIWIHAASVGEAQSTLILINTISKQIPNINFLVTTGTLTSAQLMAERLPANAIHQFYPLDYPIWIEKFLSYWKPDLILWMESELWPNMLMAIGEKNIPLALVNARLSDKSYKIWRIFSGPMKKILSNFNIMLTQTNSDEIRFKNLGGQNVVTTDNIKYSAAPLPYNDNELHDLKNIIQDRPNWVFASTHEGEELMACRVHSVLSQKIPDLLTIIIPRHPERRNDVETIVGLLKIPYVLRGSTKSLPQNDTQIYIVDTLGELGLFYKLTDIAVIGRSFSDDGGGGHNPIEAAQLGCAVLTGPNVQFQRQLFNEMFAVNAAHQMDDKTELLKSLRTLMEDKNIKDEAIRRALKFSERKTNTINTVMENLNPLLNRLNQHGNKDAS